MAGFGKTKAAQEEKKSASKVANTDPFAELREELANVDANKPKTHLFMALVGKENTGKSAIIFDFYQRYCDKHKGEGRQTTLDEFDIEQLGKVEA